jgi:hypothetical protein
VLKTEVGSIFWMEFKSVLQTYLSKENRFKYSVQSRYSEPVGIKFVEDYRFCSLNLKGARTQRTLVDQNVYIKTKKP